MAVDLRGFALEKAELISSRLKVLIYWGQDNVRAQFGVDLGLKPEVYPTWVILSTAAVGLFLVLSLSWAAVCRGLFAGEKRGSPVPQGNGEPGKANLAKPEEPKKRNKKKTIEKNTHSNGQPVAVAQEEVKVVVVVSKQAPHIRTEKVYEVQAPVQVKKNKKKTKTIVQPVKHVSKTDGKETDDGAWETKVSNREKKQQRRKDPGSEDSGSPGGAEAPKSNAEALVATAPTNTKKNKGNHVTSSRREEPSVNGGGWTDMSVKIPRQMGAMDGPKWIATTTATQYRAPPKPQSWGQETQAWSSIDGRIKTDPNPVNFSMLGLNTTDSISNSMELQWARCPSVDDEWSGFNGIAAADPSSDWSAPAEHWGNYEQPPVMETPEPPLKEQPAPNKVSEDEKDADDVAGGAAKSKKSKKKKKKSDEEAASGAQMVSTVPLVNTPKPQEPPVLTSKKQNPSISSSQKKAEQTAEPPKGSQKKKV
ncbi:metadherin a isoform X2 [Gymnodraco acuticeps]|uniref:Metadherin a isoform X2 n=1 Tax=Gymnodraco acuticeps TaxID=8218 RepID=A0A6P8TGJ7_GYMAC|nr:metadherin a isoform X2 [Gymnodraco acuticeps]